MCRRPPRWRVLPALAGVALVGFVGVMGAGSVMGPRHQYSELDGRPLATLPAPSVSSVQNGSWMTDAEAWLDDHIPSRRRWVTLHARIASQALRQPVINDVYVDDPLGMELEKPPKLHVPKVLGERARALGDSVRATGTPILWVYVPRKEEAFNDRLPGGWHNYLEDGRPAVLRAMGEGGPVLDLTPTLADPRLRDSYFWRTDHHWTPAGAMAGLEQIRREAGKMGVDIPRDDRTYVNRGYPSFYGSEGRKVTAGATPEPDDFVIPAPRKWRAHSCRSGVCDRPTFVTSLARSRDQYANRYAAFLGGDYGYQRIENSDPQAHGTIVILKDSYGDALSTYLAERVKTIIAIDERHYTGQDIARLVARTKPELVMVMHNAVSMLGNKQFSSRTWVDMKGALKERSAAGSGDG